MKINKTDKHQLICHTDDGHVMRCTCCNGLRICFRDFVMDLAADDVEQLREVISESTDTVLYIGASKKGFAFSADEIKDLNRLLDRAQLIMALEDDALSQSLKAAALFSYPLNLRSNSHASA